MGFCLFFDQKKQTTSGEKSYDGSLFGKYQKCNLYNFFSIEFKGGDRPFANIY